MYVEQLLNLAVCNTLINLSIFDQKIMTSFWSQLNNGIKLTEKQGNLCVTLLKRYKKKLSMAVGQDITFFLDNPQFKNSFRMINNKKNLKIVDHPVYFKSIKIDFPYDEDIIKKFREIKQSLHYALWDNEEKSWYLSLDERSIRFARDLVQEYQFFADEELEKLIFQLKSIEENLEFLVPMAIFENNMIRYANVSQYCPQNQSSDFIESILFTKDLGITTWDQQIENKIAELSCSDTVKHFLRHDIGKPFDINLEENSLSELSLIMKHLLPCLVIISDNNELEKLMKTVDFFQNIEILNEEMSVLFRLSSDKNGDFNQYIKDNKLNSPVSTDSKVVFVGTNIPKTILGPRLEFNSILNYNYYSAHYKIRNYIHSHKNVINILDTKPQRSFNFGNL